MANTLLFNPFIQVVNANGKPYAGAKLYTYQAGTTTPLASYANSNLTTPHTNPVVADANGTFPAIYLQKQSYKLRLETSAGVLIDETDNVDSTESAVEQYVNSLLQTTLTEIISDLYAGKDYRLTNGGTVYNQLFSVKSDVTSSDIGLNTTSNNLDINFSYVNTSSQNIRNAYISAVSTSKTAGSESANLIVGSRSGYVSVETGGTERVRFTNTGIGVNVATPTEAIDIADTVTASGDNGFSFKDVADTTRNIAIARTGGSYSYRGVTGAVGLLYSSTSLALMADDTGGNNSILFSVGGAIRAQLQWDGKFGIGTTSPATTLDVNGDVTITDKIIHSGDTDTSIRFPAVDTVTVETGGVERLRVTSTGSVGIGTTPSEQLHITGNFRIGSAVQATPSGSAPLYAARAWVNFNGTGTVAIRASGNVTSITDNGVGDYTVNFTTAMPDANYAVSGACQAVVASGSSETLVIKDGVAPTASSVRVLVHRAGVGNIDSAYVTAAIFR